MGVKTGSLGRTWVELEKPKPPPVFDRYPYWLEAPPVPSARCAYWLRQIERGWLPNRHWRAWGYDAAAELYGVYIWEYLNVISPAISARIAEADTRA